MIEVHVRELAEKAGIVNPYQLQRGAGLSPDVSQRLWRGEWDRVAKETMDRLCATLNCQPGDLFTYHPSKK